METLTEYILARFNYWTYVVLMMIGLYAMIVKRNLIKKLIGMSIFQTAIILFFISISAKEGATIPILEHAAEAGSHGAEAVHSAAVGDAGHGTPGPVNPDAYANPLPHVLMLTAIVVGVATLGVGLAVAQVIHRAYGTLEEDEILNLAGESDD